MGCHLLLQGIFPTQGSNLGLPHCKQILYHLSHQGSPTSMYSWSNLLFTFKLGGGDPRKNLRYFCFILVYMSWTRTLMSGSIVLRKKRNYQFCANQLWAVNSLLMPTPIPCLVTVLLTYIPGNKKDNTGGALTPCHPLHLDALFCSNLTNHLWEILSPFYRWENRSSLALRGFTLVMISNSG